jgi:hypothetical protein
MVQSSISRYEMSSAEICACWWTSTEHEARIKRASSLVLYTQRQGHLFVKGTITRSFDEALRIADKMLSQESNIEDPINSNGELKPSEHLRVWMKHCNGRRGLENHIIDHPSFTAMIRQHRKSVLLGSKRQGVSISGLSAASARTSLVSRMFARMKGIEDERFVSNMSQP